MKILLSGASGFLGQIVQKNLQDNQVVTIGRSEAEYRYDLSENTPTFKGSFDLIVHAAGKAHSIPKSPSEKQAFFDVNVKGTQNLLKGLEQAPSLPRSFVFISSVAVYGLDKGVNINETFPLNAPEPYGQSKIEAERIVEEWCTKNNVICAILRLPLLVGQNPPGNLDSMIKGIQKGYYLNIAGGQARKSMVLAEDVARIIPKAAKIGGVYNLTDGYHPSFKELSAHIAKQVNKRMPYNIPGSIAHIMAKVGDLAGRNLPFNSYKLSKITADLTFDDSKAQRELGWDPRKVLEVDFL